MKKRILLLSFCLVLLSVKGQNFKETILNIPTAKDSIYGTLLTPKLVAKSSLVILIPGSGPTDRDGNQAALKNNSLKYLAEALAEKGISVYRFDKSILYLMKKEGFKEEAILFTQLIDDAKFVGNFFKNENKHERIIIAGHSQGSLIGMLAAKEIADAYISLAGPGQSIDEVLKEQLLKQVPHLEESITQTLQKLKKGEKDPDFNPMLVSIFRMSIQSYLSDWMQYNPQEEIKNLEIPILIINGTKDIQVGEVEAELLHKANAKSQLVLIENMNHIFKEIKVGLVENQLSYMNPELPIMTELVTVIVAFVNGIGSKP